MLNTKQIQTPYALVKLEESARIIKHSIGELPVLRKRLDKYKKNQQKAREVYTDLQQQHSRLLGALDVASLALSEIDLPDEAEYSVKLSYSLKGFNLMTPDYTKLCAALNKYLVKLPVVDTPKTKTTNAAIIGRLISHVKTGYYPTEAEHVRYLARGIEFPEGVTANVLEIITSSLIQFNDCTLSLCASHKKGCKIA